MKLLGQKAPGPTACTPARLLCPSCAPRGPRLPSSPAVGVAGSQLPRSQVAPSLAEKWGPQRGAVVGVPGPLGPIGQRLGTQAGTTAGEKRMRAEEGQDEKQAWPRVFRGCEVRWLPECHWGQESWKGRPDCRGVAMGTCFRGRHRLIVPVRGCLGVTALSLRPPRALAVQKRGRARLGNLEQAEEAAASQGGG